ncbi:MAG: dUTP diphosphatase [Desulfuromonas sp.]|nr:MAG: dUTP diphosphatase [Desulfuromonas sp.]
MIEIPIVKLRTDAVLPRYMSQHAAGMDLCAALEQPVELQPGERTLIPTGIALSIPVGYEGQVRPRSGLALREGITMLNSPGTIDADYRGEIGVIAINHGSQPVLFNHGDRIAQLVIAPVAQAELMLVDSLDSSSRGSGGFGHTGVNRTDGPGK